MKKLGLFLFVFLLVSTVSLPLSQMAYAQITIDNKVTLDSNQTIVEDIHIQSTGELVIAKNTNIISLGNTIINNGIITIDGNLKFDNVFVINTGIIKFRCGNIDPSSNFVIIDAGQVIDAVCDDDSNIKKFDNLQVSLGKTVTFNVNDKVLLTGNTQVYGSLVNKGYTENKGMITIFAGGIVNNVGTLKNFCTNVSGRGISNFGIITGSGSVINTFCNYPIAVNDSYNMDEDGVLTVSAPGVLSNDR